MSVKRSISTSVWSDSWFETLNRDEKLLWLYLLSNSHTNMLGIYELSVRRISFETGLTDVVISKALKAFERVCKCFHKHDHIILPNWMKHQSMNPNMLKSAKSDFDELPDDVKSLIDSDVSKAFESLRKGLPTLRNIEVEYELNRIEVEYESESVKSTSKKSVKEKQILPSWKEFEAEAIRSKPTVSIMALQAKYNTWVEDGWRDGYGNAIKNWKNKLRSTLPHLPDDRLAKHHMHVAADNRSKQRSAAQRALDEQRLLTELRSKINEKSD